MTPYEKRPVPVDQTARQLPTLGLLPVLAVSAVMAGEAGAQTVRTAGEQDLGTILLQAGGEGGEAANSYKVTESDSDKMTAPLVDTPKTVTIITRKQIEERGATSLNDILRTTPGITLGTGEGGTPMGDRPFIRGFEASTDLMVDGLRSLGRSSYEAFNLESVEVIKGPGGAYSGRGGSGGSVNMTTKTPLEGETFNELSAMAGTGDQARLTYDGNMQFSEAVTARLNLMVQDSGVPGRDVLKDERLGFAPSVAVRIGDASKVTASLYHSRTENTPDFGVPMANGTYSAGGAYGSGTTADPYLPLGNVDSSNFYGSALRDYREVENNIATLKFEHEFSSNFRMASTLSWLETDQEYVVTRPTVAAGLSVVRASRQSKRNNRTLAFGTNFSGEFETGPVAHNLSFGFEISREKIRTASMSGIPTVPNTGLFDPDPWTPLTGGPITIGAFGEPTVTDTKSLYVFDTMEFSEQWQLNLGLRVDDYEIESTSLNRKDTMFNYQVGVVYKPAPNGSIYASIATSTDPAGQCAAQAGGTGAACSGADTDPEESTSYEIGTKWDLFDGLAVSAAVFRTEKDNQRTEDSVTGEWEMVGSSEAKGFELGAAGQINDQWSVFAGYTYLDARLVSGGDDTANDGKRLFNTAMHSFSLWSTYEIDDRWTVGGGATYVGKRYVNAANTAAVPSSWRVDLMAAYDINEQASVRLNVNNVFDETIYDSSHQGLFATVQPGRNATLTLDYKF